MSNLFKKGYGAVQVEAQRQEEIKEKFGKQLWRFFLAKSGDEAPIRFLTEEPINFDEHTIKGTKNGKEVYDNHICTSQIDGNCPWCANGDKPSFKGAFLIIDRRPFEYTDNKGNKKTGDKQLRLFVQGVKVLSQLDRLSERYGLTSRDYTMTRSGSGNQTSYMFDRSDVVEKLSEAEIRGVIPEKLRDMYDGTIDSLYAIVEDQLRMAMNGVDSEPEEDEKPVNRNLVGVKDEDEAPKTKTSTAIVGAKKPLGVFKKTAPKENSVKSLYRKNNPKADSDDVPF